MSGRKLLDPTMYSVTKYSQRKKCQWCSSRNHRSTILPLMMRLGSGLIAVVATGLHDGLSWNLGYVRVHMHHSQSVSDHSTHLRWRRSFRNVGHLFRITAASRSKINERPSLHVDAVVFTSCGSVWCCRMPNQILMCEVIDDKFHIKSWGREFAREPNWNGLFGCDPVDMIAALMSCYH